MLNTKELYKIHADFCKLMANPKRIEILFLLGQKEMCVEEIATAMDVRIPNISQHLALMRDKGVVNVNREGTRIYYKLADYRILQACTLMREAMVDQMEKQYELIKGVERNSIKERG